MAIDTGLTVTCGNLNAVGGIRSILLTDLDNIATVTPTSSNATHTVTGLTTTNPWARFEFKNETASLAISGTKEGGSTAYECALSFYLPQMNGARFNEVMSLAGWTDTALAAACPVALVEMNDGTMLVVGWSYIYQQGSQGSTPWDRNQTYANLTTIEGGTGAAYADDNGLTITLTARQFELPLEYTGAITILAGDVTADTA
tara:strand:- start:1387 stop:1992 length:606 start_codon:yes stop_codon:yes gene_type:complete